MNPSAWEEAVLAEVYRERYGGKKAKQTAKVPPLSATPCPECGEVEGSPTFYRHQVCRPARERRTVSPLRLRLDAAWEGLTLVQRAELVEVAERMLR